MACLGVHFAITADVAARLNRDYPPTNADVVAFLEYVGRQFDALLAEGWVEMTDKAWDGIHRSLTDGTLELGSTPRHWCILGGTDRFWVRREDGQLEYIVNLLEPGDVRHVAGAIRGIDRAEMLRGYEGIDQKSFYRLCMSEEDFEATWDSFRQLRAFFQRAADAGVGSSSASISKHPEPFAAPEPAGMHAFCACSPSPAGRPLGRKRGPFPLRPASRTIPDDPSKGPDGQGMLRMSQLCW
jgi:hypothetical protein